MRFSYLVVEGPHDVEAIGRILRQFGFVRIENIAHLNELWLPMIPKQYPPDGNLLKRVPIPVFFQKEGYSVAVHSVGGNTKIVRTLKLTLLNIIDNAVGAELFAIGVFVDADTKSAQDCCDSYCRDLQSVPGFLEIQTPGDVVVTDNKRIGIHVFPNNNDSGTLDNVLIQCAELVYPRLLIAAGTYIEEVDVSFKQQWGSTDESKVLLGCISNVLRPGRANQVSIQDNDWISSYTAELPSIIVLTGFITKLLNLD